MNTPMTMAPTDLVPETSSLVPYCYTPSEHYTEQVFQAAYQYYTLPFIDLLLQAQQVHRVHHPANEVQLCTLANIKSGNCSEDCKYCPQSARYDTGIDTWQLPEVDTIKAQAEKAQQGGSTRFCMGAAWRNATQKPEDFQRVLAYIREVKALGMEACVTLGMLTQPQALQLKEAGLTAYNHNLDTSPHYYPEVITTRTYEDRLGTIAHVVEAGISVCCGGILGMGETLQHRLELIAVLASMETAPESIPINSLVPVAGTPLQATPPIDTIDLIRTIATTRLMVPHARVRLSAGRLQLSESEQALCFLAGANAIFTGDKLLTTSNPSHHEDQLLLQKLGMRAMGV
ncbi:MAG: biotin synthase BioB [Vampirovibrionales bacterium]